MKPFKKSEVLLAPSIKLPYVPDVNGLVAEFKEKVEPVCKPNLSTNPKRIGWNRYVVFEHEEYLKDDEVKSFDYSTLPVLQKVLSEAFMGSALVSAMYAILPPQGFIGVHQDGLGSTSENLRKKIENTVRLHIPLITNEQVLMYIGDRFQRMKTGELWMLNNYAYHGVMNVHDSAARNHLILDVVPSSGFLKELQRLSEPSGYQDFARLKELLHSTDIKKAKTFRSQLPISQRVRLLFT